MYIEERVQTENIILCARIACGEAGYGDCGYVSIIHLGTFDKSEQVALIPKIKQELCY